MDNQSYDSSTNYVYGTSVSPVERIVEPSIFLGILLFVISAISIVGNVVTIMAFSDNRQLRHKTSNLLILSLSCSDLVIGATGLPFAAITFSLGSWPLGKPVCIIGAFFSVLGVAGGMYTLTAINIDRWLLVSREYSSYLRIQSLRNIKLQIAGAWTAAFLLSSCETIIWVAGGAQESEKYIDFTMECRSPVRTNPRFAYITSVLLFAVPFFIMIVCTLRFVVLLRRRLRKPKPKISSSKPALPRPADQEGEGPATTAAPKESLPASPEESEPMTESTGYGSAAITTSDASDSRQNMQKSHTSLASVGKKKSCFAFRENSGTKTNSKKMKNRYMKPAVRLAMIMSVFAVCSLPYPFFVLFADTTCPDCAAQVTARNHLSNLLLTNSALNPFLYAIMHRQIRQFHARKLRAIFCRHKCN